MSFLKYGTYFVAMYLGFAVLIQGLFGESAHILAPVLAAGCCFALRDRESRAEKSREAFLRSQLADAVRRHHSALSRNLTNAVKINDYGAVVKDRRVDAIADFLNSVGADVKTHQAVNVMNYVLQEVRRIDEELLGQGFDPLSLPPNGHDFEQWVANELRRFGWQARITPPTGDQGIDVIAEKAGVAVGIQCKRHTRQVGNSAVQQALAGQRHFGLSRAAVLTNCGFTKSAIELAASTGVILMTHHDLPQADRLLLKEAT